MTLFLAAVLIVSLFGVKVTKANADCLTRSSTSAINGVFVLLVMLSHGVGYLPQTGALDAAYLAVRAFLGQLVVATFLFYSGYGIHRQLSSRGEAYAKTLFTNRFLKVLFHFDLAVALFLLVQTLLGERYPAKTILLSFVAWEKVGNSNWYIFAVLCLYLAVFAAYNLIRKNDLAALIAVTVLTGGYVILLARFGNRPSDCWYNTVFCFPAGMWFSRYADKLLPFLQRKWTLWTASLLLTAALTVFLVNTRDPWLYNLRAVAFALFIVLVTMKVKIGNKAVCFAGALTFWIYILQRLPYILLKKAGLVNVDPYLYIAVCIAVTIPLAFGADKLVAKLDSLIWKKK